MLRHLAMIISYALVNMRQTNTRTLTVYGQASPVHYCIRDDRPYSNVSMIYTPSTSHPF